MFRQNLTNVNILWPLRLIQSKFRRQSYLDILRWQDEPTDCQPATLITLIVAYPPPPIRRYRIVMRGCCWLMTLKPKRPSNALYYTSVHLLQSVSQSPSPFSRLQQKRRHNKVSLSFHSPSLLYLRCHWVVFCGGRQCRCRSVINHIPRASTFREWVGWEPIRITFLLLLVELWFCKLLTHWVGHCTLCENLFRQIL